MKHLLKVVVLAMLSFFLQGRLSVFHIQPDLSGLLVFYVGIRYGEAKGLLSGVVIGAIEDCISSSMIGPNLLSKGIVGFSSAFFTSGSLLRWTPLLGVIAVALLTFVDNSVSFLSRSLFDGMPTALSSALFIAVMQSLMNAPAGVLIRPRHAD